MTTITPSALSPSIDRLVGALKEAVKVFPSIKERIMNANPEDQKNGYAEIIQYFEGIDYELQKTGEQLSLSLNEIIAHASQQLSPVERDLFYEAYGFWMALRKQSKQPPQPKPVRKLPKVSSLRVRV